MAKLKHADRLITMRCTVCKRRNYYTNKNKKLVERKIELQKFCDWCRVKTLHKEARIPESRDLAGKNALGLYGMEDGRIFLIKI